MAPPACVSQNILTSLREATRPAHEALENRLDWQSICSERSAYETMLARFYGFVLPWETRVNESVRDTSLAAIFRHRRKAHLLKQDLQHLDWSAERIAAISSVPAQQLPSLSSPASLLGAAYVMEGSTLGGQFITRTVSDQLKLRDNVGCSYFASYGSQVGSMWNEFCAVLQALLVDESDQHAAVLSARATFQAIDNWLSGAGA